jgi:hypothetical protein
VPISKRLPVHFSARNYLSSHAMVKETLQSQVPSYAADARRGLACRFDVAAMGVDRGREISVGAHLCAMD